MTSLEDSQAAKKKMDAEKVCTDEHCTEDHAHGHDHGDGKVCTADHGHGSHDHASHDHGGHDHSCCGGHDHAGAGEHPIAAKLKAALDATHVAVEDLSDGCGAKLKITIVSAKFEGLPLLKQHRLVNDAAKDELSAVHAFNLKTFTPAKWAAAASK